VSRARGRLFAQLMRRPPPPDRLFLCDVCRVQMQARLATFHEDGAITCRDCTGRASDAGRAPSVIRGRKES